MAEQHSKSPLVSVIVPTYNGAARIGKTLHSIIAQDYPNIEIIVVNDVSTDDTVGVARRVLTEGGRPFKIIEREKNGGQSASRNTGFDAARGKYVIFFDHDDLAEKNFVSLLCNEAEKKGANVVFCGYRHYYEETNQYVNRPVRLSRQLPSADDYIKAWLTRKILSGVWCFIFKRSFLSEKGIRFTEGCHVGEDTEFLLEALSVSDKTSFVRENLYTWVHHSSNQSTRQGAHAADFLSEKMEASYKLRSARYIVKNGTKRERNYMIYFYIPETLIHRFSRLARERNKTLYKKLLRMLKHDKIRGMLFATARYFFIAPELFAKSIMLLYFPNLYYRLRAKGCCGKEEN